jgi:hypothetical protein
VVLFPCFRKPENQEILLGILFSCFLEILKFHNCEFRQKFSVDVRSWCTFLYSQSYLTNNAHQVTTQRDLMLYAVYTSSPTFYRIFVYDRTSSKHQIGFDDYFSSLPLPIVTFANFRSVPKARRHRLTSYKRTSTLEEKSSRHILKISIVLQRKSKVCWKKFFTKKNGPTRLKPCTNGLKC